MPKCHQNQLHHAGCSFFHFCFELHLALTVTWQLSIISRWTLRNLSHGSKPLSTLAYSGTEVRRTWKTVGVHASCLYWSQEDWQNFPETKAPPVLSWKEPSKSSGPPLSTLKPWESFLTLTPCLVPSMCGIHLLLTYEAGAYFMKAVAEDTIVSTPWNCYSVTWICKHLFLLARGK